jgi:hypothetical protein
MKVNFCRYRPTRRSGTDLPDEEFVFDFRISGEELKKIGPCTEGRVRKIVEEDRDQNNTELVLRLLSGIVEDERYK